MYRLINQTMSPELQNQSQKKQEKAQYKLNIITITTLSLIFQKKTLPPEKTGQITAKKAIKKLSTLLLLINPKKEIKNARKKYIRD